MGKAIDKEMLKFDSVEVREEAGKCAQCGCECHTYDLDWKEYLCSIDCGKAHEIDAFSGALLEDFLELDEE